jgi:DNA adenine methylase
MSGREAWEPTQGLLSPFLTKQTLFFYSLMVGPLAYLGGKNRVAKKIIALIPEHTCYIEPFCGGAQILFHKNLSKVEVLNDLNEDVFNFLRVCQMHYEELLWYLYFSIVSRKWFDFFEKTPPETLIDI